MDPKQPTLRRSALPRPQSKLPLRRTEISSGLSSTTRQALAMTTTAGPTARPRPDPVRRTTSTVASSKSSSSGAPILVARKAASRPNLQVSANNTQPPLRAAASQEILPQAPRPYQGVASQNHVPSKRLVPRTLPSTRQPSSHASDPPSKAAISPPQPHASRRLPQQQGPSHLVLQQPYVPLSQRLAADRPAGISLADPETGLLDMDEADDTFAFLQPLSPAQPQLLKSSSEHLLDTVAPPTRRASSLTGGTNVFSQGPARKAPIRTSTAGRKSEHQPLPELLGMSAVTATVAAPPAAQTATRNPKPKPQLGGQASSKPAIVGKARRPSANKATEQLEAKQAPTFRKTSAVLREQIAQARAAAAAARKATAANSTSSSPTTIKTDGEPFAISPLNPNFDFATSSSADPFNLSKKSNPLEQELRDRAETGRTTGRLNIAALNLKEIPEQVLKMYNLESVDHVGGSCAESVDLIKLVAADNEIEVLDDSWFPDCDLEALMEQDDTRGTIFAGLELLDLHGNQLSKLPVGLGRLRGLTVLNLDSNCISDNSVLELLSQLLSLRDLKLSRNKFSGPLPECLTKLENLAVLDLHGNKITQLPDQIGHLAKLRVLDVSENELTAIPFASLAKTALTELNARRNKLVGTLIPDDVDRLNTLQTLDVSNNQLRYIATDLPSDSPNRDADTNITMPKPPSSRTQALALPALMQLNIGTNRLQALPTALGAWTQLVTLVADGNALTTLPSGFPELVRLRHADLSSNDLRIVPPGVARMHALVSLRLAGNPLRDKRFLSMDTDALKDALLVRLNNDNVRDGVT